MAALDRPIPARAALAAVLAVALLAVGCGGEINVDEPDRSAAVLFNERCSGCHSLKVANSYGSKSPGRLAAGERTNGPNFGIRKVSREDALFAIRNGGFSGAIMPANVVVGAQAEEIAAFLAKYSGGRRGTDR